MITRLKDIAVLQYLSCIVFLFMAVLIVCIFIKNVHYLLLCSFYTNGNLSLSFKYENSIVRDIMNANAMCIHYFFVNKNWNICIKP